MHRAGGLACVLALAVVAACGGSSAKPDAMPRDAAMPDAAHCYGQGISVCLPAAPSMPLSVTSATTVDTGNAASCTYVVPQTLGPELCVIAGTTVTISGTLTATGSRPLVLLATGNEMIDGAVDVSSHSGRIGAGGNDVSCQASMPGQPAASGAGGGAGGSFGTAGGAGGKGTAGAVAGGAPAPASGSPSVLRGGCAGAAGGVGTAADAPPGAGGGAVYLLAGATLTIDGTIDASGAGGGGGRASKGGGSGGGSGGMIALSAQSLVDQNSIIFANGGGGGGGADNGAQGNPGLDPTMPQVAATGGGGGGGGGPGHGGPGAYLTIPAGAGGDDVTGAGGGGGGGGAGVVRVLSGQQLKGNVSPPQS